MSPGEVADALGGGLLGVLGGLLVAVCGVLYWELKSQISARDKRIEKQDQRLEELTRALDRQSDVIEGWLPSEQRRRLRS